MDPEYVFKAVDKALGAALKKYEAMPLDELVEARYRKVRKIGVFLEK